MWRLALFITGIIFLLAPAAYSQDYMLRFYGNGVSAPDQDRVKILVDEVGNSNPGPPADVGSTDFTIEWWMRADGNDNDAGAVTCGANNNWINGNIIVDRDRFNQDRNFGVSMGNDRLVFGVYGDGVGPGTICGSVDVLDNNWHHIAVQRRRSDGFMWIWVDGVLDVSGDGPNGDISYPDDGDPGDFCGDGNDPCDGSDPFIVIGAEKHDAGSQFPSYNGFFDEMRISNILRYSSTFPVPTAPFVTDANTVALYHFDEGTGTTINDSSGFTGGPSNGVRNVGGSPSGPEWLTSTVPYPEDPSPEFPGVPTSLSTSASSSPALPGAASSLSTSASSSPILPGISSSLSTSASSSPSLPGVPTGLTLP